MSWSNPAFATLADLIGARTGLVFAPGRRAGAEIGVRRAMDRAGEPSLDRYARQVARDSALLDDLLIELTVGETYFFREPGQFEFIRRVALPEVRRCRGSDHPIRVWSAGCASGEEAYSLAMLLDREGLTGPIPVLATDISRGALAKARRAVYTDWSLRGEGAGDARLYLRKEEGRHVVVESIRGRVAFEHLNLALDVYPSYATGTRGIDLILCRNVLIYLDPETVQAVARRFFEALAEGGWLVAASSDPPLAGLAPFEVVVTEEGTFYRRGVASPLAADSASGMRARLVSSGEEALSVAVASEEGDRDAILAAAREDMARGDYHLAADRTRGLVRDAEAAALHVRALANLDPARAEPACGEAITSHPFSAEIHQLRAVLLVSLGRDSEAARAARRVIYLDRTLAIAHFLLGTILCRQGDHAGAWRAFRNARDLCAARPADEAVPLADGESSGRLADASARQMARLVVPVEAEP